MKKEAPKYQSYTIGRLATMIADYSFEKGVNYVELNEVDFHFADCSITVSGEVYNGEEGLIESSDFQSVTFNYNDEYKTKMTIDELCKLIKLIR